MKKRSLVLLLLAVLFILCPAAHAEAKAPTVYGDVNYSRVYNYKYFIRNNPEAAKKAGGSAKKALEYFVKKGMALGLRASSAFDPKSYRYGNADLRRKYGKSWKKYYLHYIKTGYKNKARRKTATGISAMQDALTVYQGVNYSRIYDYNYYVKRYPWVARVKKEDDAAVLAWFVENGMKKRMVAKNPALYPDAKPSSAVYTSLWRRTLYPEGDRLPADYVTKNEPATWNEHLLRVISNIKNGGGYSTGVSPTSRFPVTAGEALDRAFVIRENKARPSITAGKARPSYCSGAVYTAMMKALLNYDKAGKISREAWIALKPYTVSGGAFPPENDGEGCYGRANANGPGVAVLIRALGAGKNIYIGNRSEYKSEAAYWKVWNRAQPGDLLKIFRDDRIGTTERGHMVVYLGHRYALDEDGRRDDEIYYWSSQSSTGGIGITKCRASEIYRGVLTQITNPDAFGKAAELPPSDRDEWLASLISGHEATAEEMKKHI